MKLYDKKDGQPVLVDEVEATHVGCEYGEYDELELMTGDRLLLCTDGLTNEVDNAAMCALLTLPAEEAAQALIRAALDDGGMDNITVTLMDID